MKKLGTRPFRGACYSFANRSEIRVGVARALALDPEMIITHNLNVFRHITDRMAIMYLGRFVEQGQPEEIFHHACTPTPRRCSPPIRNPIPMRPSGCEFHTRCLYAQQKRREVPPEVTKSPASHFFTCHFPLRGVSA